MASSWRSLLKDKIQCTIKRQRNRGAIYSKMTIDKR